jgi:hypothetical protein
MYSLVLREKYQLEIKANNAISIVHAKKNAINLKSTALLDLYKSM